VLLDGQVFLRSRTLEVELLSLIRAVQISRHDYTLLWTCSVQIYYCPSNFMNGLSELDRHERIALEEFLSGSGVSVQYQGHGLDA
jgi:hypothetical protein